MNLISQTFERMQAPGNKVRKRISTFQYSRNDKKVKRGKAASFLLTAYRGGIAKNGMEHSGKHASK
jgi:hypothetical protein